MLSLTRANDAQFHVFFRMQSLSTYLCKRNNVLQLLIRFMVSRLKVRLLIENLHVDHLQKC